MLRTCCLVLCLVAGSRQLSIPTFIVPNAVEAGHNAELQCQYTLDATDSIQPYLKWWWTPIYGPEEDEIQLFQRIGNDASVIRPSIIEHIGNNTILIKNPNHLNSGIYECEVSGDTEIRLQQELIVFSNGNGPQLNISEVEDGSDDDNEPDVLLKCEADDVSPEPELSITVNSKEIDNITTRVTSESDGLYNISAEVTLSKEEVDGAEIRCELFYKNQNVSHPPYVDAELYDPTGAVAASTEPLDVATQPATQSLNDESSDCNGLQASGILLVIAMILMI
ncbi:uncharacterized protein ACR2FA_001763 [Aphomia sociella]